MTKGGADERKTRSNKQREGAGGERGQERLGVTVHTTIITGMRTTVKMEEWKRKDRQSTAEERLRKNK